ncbi:hypothetical protein ABRZ24_10860 [Brenneria populi]|uniref:Lipoprotein n=1 Tax=Brenneria populi TaxID=1505588 RepID=A0ABU6JR61_9GAMM|nr:hypothetical protein [Brenneria populi Li et al. 2015]
MNCLTKILVIVLGATLICGCGDKTDQTLSPPDNAHYVRVLFRVPDGTTLMPMQVLYRSEKCMDKSYNSSFESYPVRGYNGFTQPFVRQGHGNIWQTSIAIDGGGSCQWQLNSLRVSFKIADNHPLVKGKKVIETSYIFDFGDYGLSDGYGTGRAKEVSGDLDLKTDFFPMVTNHIDNTVSLKFFGGDTGLEKWRRRFLLSDTQNIFIEPSVHLTKVVMLNPPDNPGNLTAIYPDGSSEEIPHIYPDYEKLLSMK